MENQKTFKDSNAVIAFLREHGWFDGMPGEVEERYLLAIENSEGVASGEAQTLAWFIPTTPFGVDCIFEEGDHKKILEDLGEGSCGWFATDSIEESWEETGGLPEVRVRAVIGGQPLEDRWELTGDDVEFPFFQLMFEAANKQGLCVAELHGDDSLIVGKPEPMSKLEASGELPMTVHDEFL